MFCLHRRETPRIGENAKKQKYFFVEYSQKSGAGKGDGPRSEVQTGFNNKKVYFYKKGTNFRITMTFQAGLKKPRNAGV